MMAAAIGESGALISTLPPKALAETEKDGVTFAEKAGASSLADLRALTSDQIMDLAAPAVAPGGRGAAVSGPGPLPARPTPRLSFGVNLDGYFLPKTLPEIFEAGEQAKIPLLAGTNSAEQGANSVLGQNPPTVEGFSAAVHRLYPNDADQVLKVYAPTTPDEVVQAATDLASARFIALGTWKWEELQAKNSGKRVYRYYYARIRPRYLGIPGETANAGAGGRGGRGGAAPIGRGAAHSAEIQYALGNLDLDNRYAWDADDHKVSDTMQAFFANFIKTFNPNGSGLPEWPSYNAKSIYARMHIDVDSHSESEPDRPRYEALYAIAANRR
jgi:para-nitrobenzyl esterase